MIILFKKYTILDTTNTIKTVIIVLQSLSLALLIFEH